VPSRAGSSEKYKHYNVSLLTTPRLAAVCHVVVKDVWIMKHMPISYHKSDIGLSYVYFPGRCRLRQAATRYKYPDVALLRVCV
jgi:hypothetical protein